MTMLDPAAYVSTPAEGRSCGTCALCCKVFDVPVLEKPAGQWCQHCTPGKGCAIHETRPEHCRAFHCFWMLAPFLGPEWKPEKCRFVLTIDPISKFMLIQLDPAQPTAWKKDPYYSQIKRWAIASLPLGRQVIVFLNKSATVVMPDADVEMGEILPGERIAIKQRQTPIGLEYKVEKLPPQG